MSDGRTIAPEDWEALAAEFALGVLSGGELADAERLEAREPDFRRLVEAWRLRLAPLALAVQPVVPPAALWALIEARLPGGRGAEAQGLVQQLAHRVKIWRMASAVLALAAMVLAVLVAVPTLLRPPAPERFVAVLGEGAQNPQFLVTVDLQKQVVSIMPVAEIGTPTGDFELWLVKGDQAPKSLGLISASDGKQLRVGAVAQSATLKGGLLAISVEPKGGSPTGAPTGPVIYTGPLLVAPE